MARRLLTVLLALSLGAPPSLKAAPSGIQAEGRVLAPAYGMGAGSLGTDGSSSPGSAASLDLSLAEGTPGLSTLSLPADPGAAPGVLALQARGSVRPMPADGPAVLPMHPDRANPVPDARASPRLGRDSDPAGPIIEEQGRFIPPSTRETLGRVGKLSRDTGRGARGPASMDDSYARAGWIDGNNRTRSGDVSRAYVSPAPVAYPFRAGYRTQREGWRLGRGAPAQAERVPTDVPDVLAELPKEWVSPETLEAGIRSELARNGVKNVPEFKFLPAGSSRRYAYDFENNVLYFTLNEKGLVELVAGWEEGSHAEDYLTGRWSKDEFMYAAKAGGDVGAANKKLADARTPGERADALAELNDAWTRYQLNRPESSAKRKALEQAHQAALARLREIETRLAQQHPAARHWYEPAIREQLDLVRSYRAAIGWFKDSFRYAQDALESGLHRFAAPEYALAASTDLAAQGPAYAYLTVGEPAAAGSLRRGDLVWVTPAAGGQPRLGIVIETDVPTEIWFLDAHGAFESGEQAAWQDIAPRLRHVVRHEPADVEQRLAYLEGAAQRRQSRSDEGVRRVLGELIRELAPADWRTVRPGQVSPQLARLFQAVLSLELDTPQDQAAYRSPARLPEFSPVGELFRAGIGIAHPAEGAQVAPFEDLELEVRPAFGSILEGQLRARKAEVDDRFGAEAFANRLQAGLAVVLAPFDDAADTDAVLRKFPEVEVELSSFRAAGEPIMILSLGWGGGAVPRLSEFSYANAHSNYPDDGAGAQSGADQIAAASAFANHLARYEIVFAGFGGEPGRGVVAWVGHRQPRSWHVARHPDLTAPLRAAGFIR